MESIRVTAWLTRFCAALVLTLAPGLAAAHLASTGLGPFYDGVSHFLLSPEDLVPAVGIALLAGLRGTAHARRVVFALPLAWLLGGLVALHAAPAYAGLQWSAAWFVGIGALIVVDAKLPVAATTALAALTGAVHGYFNGSGLGISLTTGTVLIGLTLAVCVLTVLCTAPIVLLRAHWARLAVRVVGSWIAASGVLMFGWWIRIN
jgi:urease accessory protein